MDNNNNNGNNNQKKNYKKRHYHHRGRRPNKPEKVSEVESLKEDMPLDMQETLPEVKPEATVDSQAPDTNLQKEVGRRNNRNRRGGKNQGNRNYQYENGEKNEKKTDAEAAEPSVKAEDTATSFEVPEKSLSSFAVKEEETVEDLFENVDGLDLLDEQESVSELLMIDGADGLDLIAEENNEKAEVSDDGTYYEVVGVRFGAASKTYYFDPAGMDISVGNGVIVETVRGDKYGICNMRNSKVPDKNVFLPLKKVIRIATEDDKIVNEENIILADDAFKKCNKKIAEHGLDMKLIEATYTHDRNKLIFFFTAPTRVDFRELVKDLAALFKTRIDLRQIGIRDEAKMIGGYGICGRSLCCCSFLPNFNQVSIKMAKDQNLSLNTSKISGVCGRLMCCLKFEHKTYLDEAKLMPPIGSVVKTPDGTGEITEVNPIGGTVKVRLSDNREAMPKAYSHKDVTIVKRGDTHVRDDGDESDSSN